MAAETARESLIALLKGVEYFNTNVFPEKENLFKELADGQAPATLFITCADSRVSPNLITQTDPGNLFVLRNIGNIVPAYGEMLGGVSSAIEYAVVALGVSSIIVCGHSNCGAMTALMEPEKLTKMPTVQSWLRNAETARAVVGALTGEDAGPATVRCLAEQNVLLQLSHLRTHPSVAAALATQKLVLQGWFYDIGTGEVLVLDEETRKTISIEDALARLEQAAPAAAS